MFEQESRGSSEKVWRLTRLFGAPIKKGSLFKVIERESAFILDNFKDFLPTWNESWNSEVFMSGQSGQHILNLFEIYSIISLSRAELFLNLLTKLEGPNLMYDAFIMRIFSNTGIISTNFEMAFILNSRSTCQEIVLAHKYPEFPIQDSLSCLNIAFNTPPIGVTLKHLQKEIDFKQDYITVMNNLPSSYHGRLLRFIYSVYNVDLKELHRKAPNSFCRFIPQAIAFSSGLTPLEQRDEEYFMQFIQKYNSSEDIKEMDLPDQITNFGKCMSLVYQEITKFNIPINLLDFCEEILKDHSRGVESNTQFVGLLL